MKKRSIQLLAAFVVSFLSLLFFSNLAGGALADRYLYLEEPASTNAAEANEQDIENLHGAVNLEEYSETEKDLGENDNQDAEIETEETDVPPTAGDDDDTKEDDEQGTTEIDGDVPDKCVPEEETMESPNRVPEEDTKVEYPEEEETLEEKEEPEEEEPEEALEEKEEPEEDGEEQAVLRANPRDYITDIKVEIFHETGAPVVEGDTILRDETLRVRYYFSAVDEHMLEGGDTLTFTIPEQFEYDWSRGLEFDVTWEDTDLVIGRVKLTEGSRDVVFTFTDLIESVTLHEAYFNIFMKVSAAAGNGGNTEIYFEFEGEAIEHINVHIEEKELRIEKKLTGTYEDEGYFYQTWRVVANLDEMELRSTTISETPQDPNVSAVHFQFEGYALNELPDGWRVNRYPGGQYGTQIVLEYNYYEQSTLPPLTEKIVIDFTTQVRDPQLLPNGTDSNADKYDVWNAVFQYPRANSQGESVFGQDHAYIPRQWLEKTGAFRSEQNSVEWSVVVNTSKHRLYKNRLVDILPEFLDIDSMQATLLIKETGAEVPIRPQTDPVDYAYTYTLEPQADGTTKMVLFFPEYITDCYELRYSFGLEEDFWTQPNNYLTNRAYLEWDVGDGHITLQEIGSTIVVDNTTIQKRGTVDGRFINWTTTINPEPQDWTGVISVKDTIPTDQKAVQGSWRVEGTDANGNPVDLSGCVIEHDPDENTVTYTFPNNALRNVTAQLYLQTEIVDYAFLMTNGTRNFDNLVTLSQNGVPLSSNRGVVEVESKILEKTFDHIEGRHILFNVVLNPLGLETLGSVVLTDTFRATNASGTVEYSDISPYLSLEGIYWGSYAEENRVSPDRYTYNTSTRTMRMELTPEEVSGKTVNLVVSVAIAEEFLWSDDIYSRYCTNNIEALIENADEVARDSDTSRSFRAFERLVKTGTYNKDTSVIAWQVVIGQGQDWLYFPGLHIRDELPAGLVLDTGSVRLEGQAQYGTATQNSSGWNVPNSRLTVGEHILYDPETNLFEFVFPEATRTGFTDSTHTYVHFYTLHFNTYVTASGTYENKIYMKYGDKDFEDGNTVYVTSDDYEAGSSGRERNWARITLYKTNELDEPLAGARFEVRELDGTFVDVGTTDANGEIKFHVPLTIGRDYQLVEVKPPSGYDILPTPIPVKVERNPDGVTIDATTLRYEASNTHRTKDWVIIKKTDESGTPLAGVTFRLWNSQNEYLIGPTDENGEAALYSAEPGVYQLQEVEAPDGYRVDDTPRAVSITNASVDINITVKNFALPVSQDILFYKTNRERQRMLPGAEFTLYECGHVHNNTCGGINDPAKCTHVHSDLDAEHGNCWVMFGTQTSGDDGAVAFMGLTIGNAYALRETKPPDGFREVDGYWLITVDEQGDYRIEAKGQPPAFAFDAGQDKYLLVNILDYAYPLTLSVPWVLAPVGVGIVACTAVASLYNSKKRRRSYASGVIVYKRQTDRTGKTVYHADKVRRVKK